MKNHKITLLSTAALATGAFLLLAPNAMAADPKTKLNSADTRFIQKEAAAGVSLVRIGELGVKNADRTEVKQFAEKIVADHTKANAELATLAQSKGVELTSEVDSRQANTHRKLEAESGVAFDKEFLSVVVSSHKKCLKNFEDAAEDAKDSEVKAWAAKMVPALQAHLERAEELSASPTTRPGTTSATSAETTPGTIVAGTTAAGTTPGTAAGAAPGSSTRSGAKPDNTARNERDRDSNTLTPLNQGNSKADIDTTAQIRKGILDLDDISVNAKNVKVITKEGRVTLRGPVDTAEEKRLIGEIANRAVTSENADNQLEVKRDKSGN